MVDEFKDLNQAATFIEDKVEMDDADLYPFPTTEFEDAPKRILGMTPGQLFFISIELFFLIFVFGLFFMIVTERIVLPF